MRIITSIFLMLCMAAGPAFAQAPKRYASIVVDADTQEIIHARQIDGQRFPASLTKVMTLYLTFDALDAGTLSLSDKLTASRKAALTPPVEIGLKTGQTITVEQAIQALTVRSANDAAVVLAEHLGGSEQAFADMMTAKARSLQMQRTIFKTANGLPHPDQTTTARDMAKLATAALTHHRRYYHYFGQKTFTWKGRTFKNTNSLLHGVDGVDGFKTGYTNASGYNLIISAQRNGRRIVAVVLGGASGKSRDQHMRDLIDRSFKVVEQSPAPARSRVVVTKAPPVKTAPKLAKVTTAVRLRGQGKDVVSFTQGRPGVSVASKSYDTAWSIEVGAFNQEAEARAQLTAVAAHPRLQANMARIAPWTRGPRTLYRARFTGLAAPQAQEICGSMQYLAAGCVVIAPGG